MEELLKQLIEFLKTTSPQLWGILMKQVYSDAVVSLFTGSLFLVVLIVCISRALKLYKRSNDKDSDYYRDDYDMQYVAIGMIAFLAILAVMFALPLGIQRFYNPEYYAISDILDTLKGAR